MAFEITLERMIIFFLILFVGFATGKLSIITRDYLPQLAKLITKVFLPVLLFWSTFRGTTWQMVADNALAIVFSVVFYASIAAVTFLIAKVMRIRPDRDRVFMLCFVFGNTGFVGMPLLSALFPTRGFCTWPFSPSSIRRCFGRSAFGLRRRAIERRASAREAFLRRTSSRWRSLLPASCFRYGFPRSFATRLLRFQAQRALCA